MVGTNVPVDDGGPLVPGDRRSPRARSFDGQQIGDAMRDDDVRLTDGERAAFEDLARRLTDDGVERDAGAASRRVFSRTSRRLTLAWMLVAIGVAGMVAALLTAAVWAGGGAVLVLVIGVHQLTRRWNWSRLRRWWKRRPAEPPSAR
jgi:hypothetical protein